jgi:hypothetical protein
MSMARITMAALDGVRRPVEGLEGPVRVRSAAPHVILAAATLVLLLLLAC